MSIASEQSKCPKCGGPIPLEAPLGLCPKCLLAEVSVPTEAGHGSKSPAPSVEELAAAFPHLEILELIGQGGMGFVFKARQPKLDRFVALKILPHSLAADPAFAERFTREGRVLARLNHPNIVTIHDFGQANGFFYLLMEFVDGVNLRQAMRAGRFTAPQALGIVPRICDALQYAHDEGVLHRDIKPENILLDAKGRVKIADFGIGKMIGEASAVGVQPPGGPASASRPKPELQLTQAGTALGTPQYMAPEQREHPDGVDHRADIYSLGVVFYELLTGELPVGKFAPPSVKSASDPRLDGVVRQALEKERDRRQQSAGEVRTQVETIAASSTPGVVVYRPGNPPFLKTEPRPPTRLALLALGLLLAGTLGTLLLMTISHRHEMALIFGATALVLASIFGVMSWRERLGKGVVIATLVLVVGLGVTAAILAGGWMLAGTRAEAEARRQELREKERARDMENAATASLESWSPPLEPGEKPNPEKIRQEAANLTAQGRYEEALQRQLWYHNHALEIDHAQSGVRLSFALSQWLELARRYPKAMRALIEVRDRSASEFVGGGGYFDLFMEVRAINKLLREEDATYALFKSIQSRDPELARQCYHAANDLLLERGDYALCAGFIPDFQVRFENVRTARERTLALADRTPQANQTLLRLEAQRTFIKETQRLIEVLVGIGRKAEAEKIREQAVVVLDVPELQSAVTDAEKKVAKGSTRNAR